jgi:predicted nucleic acid-binding protein
MPKKKKAKKPAVRFVLDGSITVSWAFEDETDAYAETVGDALPDARAFVPSLWPLEVGNALLVGERRGRITEAQISQFLALLQTQPIILDEETAARAWNDSMHLARTHRLSVYDASYLELAIRRGLPLATLDAQLHAAAANLGVAIFAP